VLRCAGLWKAFGRGASVLRDVTLSVARGECFGLLGPNGAGKTTTIEILEGLLRPTSGEVEVLGRCWTRDERELRQRIGITLQGTRLPEKLTAGETIDLFASFYRRPLEPLSVLRTLGLDARRDVRVRVMSEGQRQRLAVACALVGRPELLFLDEPTTGLDPHSRQQLWQAIQHFCGAGGTVMLTTNNMDEAERLCHRVAIIDGGTIVASGAPADLVRHLGDDRVVERRATLEDVFLERTGRRYGAD
jgi:ABC-2 type transport system ATP-binding protein